MADRLTPDRRSWNMRRIGSRNTTPELRVRRLLHKAGFRYRLHVANLPGKPDIVLKRHQTVIFVNGCFWHRHNGCRFTTTPNTNTEYWQRKFARTIDRDTKARAELEEQGWKVTVIWECQTRNDDSLKTQLSGSLPGLR